MVARMRVVVLGGRGHLGRRAAQALERLGAIGAIGAMGALGALGAEQLVVEIASRSSPLRVDLDDPASFEALVGADVVLDLADTTTSAPDALARFCLERGVVLLEGSSDPATVRRLAALAAEHAGSRGALVLGAGIFSGVSNLLAREVCREACHEAAGAPRELVLGISSSPYSGAGAGTVALMVAMLSRPAVRWSSHTRAQEALARGPALDFGGARRPTLRAAFAEQEMLGPSTGAASVDVLFAPRPALLVALFLALPARLLASSAMALVMRAYFSIVRRFVLARVTSRVELVAEAVGPEGRRARRALACDDGMEAGGVAAAAMVGLLLERLARGERPRGVSFVDDLLELDEVVSRSNALASPRATLRWVSPAGPGGSRRARSDERADDRLEARV
jgi:NAD(P)-dependent dehydrogenase (short-subunit alcohol dehydrogenase family)